MGNKKLHFLKKVKFGPPSLTNFGQKSAKIGTGSSNLNDRIREGGAKKLVFLK